MAAVNYFDNTLHHMFDKVLNTRLQKASFFIKAGQKNEKRVFKTNGS